MLDIIAHHLLLGAYSVCVHHDSVFCGSFSDNGDPIYGIIY